MKIIARIHTGFEEKFGIPRQSGLAQTQAEIIFEPPYNIREAVRGLEEFSHIWILWDFSECHKEQQEREWNPTVRPPRPVSYTHLMCIRDRYEAYLKAVK